MDEALKNFGHALGRLKRAYSEKCGISSNYIRIYIDESDNVTILPRPGYGSLDDAIETWVDIDE